MAVDIRPGLSDALTYLEFGACAVAFLPLLAAARVAERGDPTHRGAGRWLRRFGRTTARLRSAWDFRVEGVAPPDIGERGYVVVANHASIADPFLLSFLPWDMRWVAKGCFRTPLVGWLVRLGGDIPLQRGSAESARTMAAECERTLERGLSVMLFPEGTRSRDGGLLPFKDGAFRLAIEAGVPVLPIAIDGTHTLRPKGSRMLGHARATARILAPISTEGFTRDDVPQLRDLARSRIAEALALP